MERYRTRSVPVLRVRLSALVCVTVGGLLVGCGGATRTAPTSSSGTTPALTASAALHVLDTYVGVAQHKSGAAGPFERVDYTFLVKNTDPTQAIADARYAVEFVDAAGSSVGRGSGVLAAAMPNTATAVSDQATSSRPPTAMRVTFYGGSAIDAGLYAAISPITAIFDPATHEVRGTIEFPADVEVRSEPVVAVLYDVSGAIVGGGVTYTSVATSRQASVKLVIQGESGTPTRTMLFPQPVRR